MTSKKHAMQGRSRLCQFWAYENLTALIKKLKFSLFLSVMSLFFFVLMFILYPTAFDFFNYDNLKGKGVFSFESILACKL